MHNSITKKRTAYTWASLFMPKSSLLFLSFACALRRGDWLFYCHYRVFVVSDAACSLYFKLQPNSLAYIPIALLSSKCLLIILRRRHIIRISLHLTDIMTLHNMTTTQILLPSICVNLICLFLFVFFLQRQIDIWVEFIFNLPSCTYLLENWPDTENNNSNRDRWFSPGRICRQQNLLNFLLVFVPFFSTTHTFFCVFRYSAMY